MEFLALGPKTIDRIFAIHVAPYKTKRNFLCPLMMCTPLIEITEIKKAGIYFLENFAKLSPLSSIVISNS